MKKLLASVIFSLIFVTTPSGISAQQRSIQLDPYYPITPTSANPATPSPTSRPGTPVTPSPTSPTTLSTPTPTQPPGRTSPPDFCNSIQAVYFTGIERTLDTEPDRFIYLYPSAEFIQANPNNFVLNRLQSNSNFSRTQDSTLLHGVALTVYNNFIARVETDPAFAGDIMNQARNLGFEQIGPTTLNPISFYYLLHRLLDFTAEQHEYFHLTISDIDRELQRSQLPKFPFLVTNTNRNRWEPYDATPFLLVNVYPSASTWHVGMNILGCAPDRPRFTYSASPVIHLYPQQEEKITLAFPQKDLITTAFPQFSLKRGFEVIANPQGELFDQMNKKLVQNHLYYEFAADQKKFSDQIPIAVIQGKNVKEFMYSTLIPKLQLTNYELQTYRQDIEKSLPQIDINKYYKVFVMQNAALDTFWQIDINPNPSTFIRNVVVLKPTDEKPFVLKNMNLQTPIRSGLTVVENGFVVFQN